MSRPLVGVVAALALILAWVPASDAQLQNALGNCKYYTKTQQDFEQGLPYCRQCIEDEPENPEARYYGAWCLAEMGRFDEAWTSFKWLIDRKGDKDKKIQKHAKWAQDRVQSYFAKHFNEGVKFLNANDLASAKDEFKAATQIYPT
jgi:tetratricopeptide (TPR) repeat protein